MGVLLYCFKVVIVLKKIISKEQVQIPTSAVSVNTAEIGYNKGPLYSNSFSICSAVILDYGDNAFLAHALPPIFSSSGDMLHYDGVVEGLIEESKKRNLDPKKGLAIVNTYSRRSLNKLVRELKKYDIPVRVVKTKPSAKKLVSTGFLRNVLYLPKSDSLIIYSTKFPK